MSWRRPILRSRLPTISRAWTQGCSIPSRSASSCRSRAMTEDIRLERDGPVATLTLARAAKLNALTRAMLGRLAAIADELERDHACRVVILTGEGGKAFCAGADIAEWSALGPLELGRLWVGEGHRVF